MNDQKNDDITKELIPEVPYEGELPPGTVLIRRGDLEGLRYRMEFYEEARKRLMGLNDEFGYWSHANNLKDLALNLTSRLRNDLQYAYIQMNDFGDDVETQLRAMLIVIQGVLSASTHHEKDARLRGLQEIVEYGIGRLKQVHFDKKHLSRYPESLFASDSSRSKLQRQVWELEKRLDEALTQVQKLESGATNDSDELGDDDGDN